MPGEFVGIRSGERRIAPKALGTFKKRIREMTHRTRGFSLIQLIEELRPYLIGWRGYFGFCQTTRVLTNLEAWIRRRLRSYLWRQWQNGRNRFKELRRRGVPPREGKSLPPAKAGDALDVNWIGVTIADAKGKIAYDGAFVTSPKVSRENVAEIAACARARWKIENDGFNILKNNGYRLEHNFGHGNENLAMPFAAMNLPAFAIHTVRDCREDLWIEAREAKRARKRFFEHIRTITAYLVFPSWKTLMTTLVNSKPPPEIEKRIGA